MGPLGAHRQAAVDVEQWRPVTGFEDANRRPEVGKRDVSLAGVEPVVCPVRPFGRPERRDLVAPS
jgi:hypothetical protein